MTTPTDQLLNAVAWEAVEPPKDAGPDGLPYCTHKGVLSMFGVELRCYVLNDGRRIFDGDDIRKLLEGIA